MQKKLLTVAVASALALPGAAMAVEVFGTIDTGIRNISKLDLGTGATGSRLGVDGGTRTTNRWGFRGSEDLGGGLMANYWFEGTYTSDDNTDTLDGFNRKNLVGLSKGGMSVDLGRDYTVNFKSQGIYDPMSYTYTGITPTAGTNTAGVRSNNLITAGFRFGTGGIRVDYAAGEVIDENAWGTRTGLMADFAFGPVTVTGAYSTMDDAATGNVTTDTMNIGAAYKMGAFTFRAGWSNTEVDTVGAETESPLLVFGVQYGFSPTLNGRIGYYDLKNELNGADNGKVKTFIVALDYYLSKRTTMYVEVDRRTLDDTAEAAATGTAGARRDGSTGIGVGVVHAF